MDTTPDSPSTIATPPSRWALAVRGDPVALSELAGSYWYCGYVWWRRSGLDAEAAGTATVASFTRWMTTRPPSGDDSGAGLMREWLPGRLAELAAEGWDLDGEPTIVIEPQWAEGRYADEPEGEPEAVFHRRWTLTVLEFTMQALRAEYAVRGMETLFAEVSPFVAFEKADEAQAHYAAAAERAGMTTGALKREVFDFRTHHRDVLRTIVADTVADPADINAEITALLCACELPGSPAPLPTAIRTFKPDELLARAMNTVHMTSGGLGKWKPPTDEEAAGLFPQYEMHGIIGRGGMGAVYRARQVALDREVAIKLLPLEVSVDQAFADRFVREARAMAKLSHPNIISVFDFGTTGEGHLFFVMEYVEGANVSEIIRGPGLGPDQAVAIAGQVCTALAYAHGRGVVHRDIKPANVMVGTDGTAKVADFGLARVDGADPAEFGQTVTGTIMGTAEYMSPEQKRGMAVDHRADIYSVGVMLYEMLCKEPPQGAFEPPSQRAGCDARLDQIVLKAMHRTPEGRYQSTTEMKMDLEASRTPLPSLPSRPPGHFPPPRGNAAMRRIAPLPPPKESHAGLITVLVAGALALVAAAFFFQQKKPVAAKTAARPPIATPPAATAPPASTPVPVPVPPPEETAKSPAEMAAKPEPIPVEVPPASPAKVEPAPAVGKWVDGLATGRVEGPSFHATTLASPLANQAVRVTGRGEGWGVDIRRERAAAGRGVRCYGIRLKKDAPGLSCGFVIVGKSYVDIQVLPWPAGFDWNVAHQLEVRAVGKTLSIVLDGAKLGAVTDGQLAEGYPAAWADLGSTIERLEYMDLGRSDAADPGTPSVDATTALIASDPHLVKLDAAFKARFDSDAQKPYLALVAALNQSYLVNGVARLRVAAQARGSLDEVTALDAERAAIARGEGVPATDDGGTPEALKVFRTSYRMAMAKYNADRAKTAGQLYEMYLASLEAYVAELTRANKIDDAKKMKVLREEIAGKKAELAQAGATDSLKAGSRAGASASDLKAPAGGSVREAAKWLLTMGGKFTVAKGTLESDVLTEREIPPGKFDIVGIALDKRDPKLPPPADTDFQFLRGIKTLRTVTLSMTGYGDTALAFLADDLDLTTVHLSGPANLTDGVLSHLDAGSKITGFALTSAGNFTGKGLRRMHWLPVLTKADFSGSGLSDEGLKELIAARRLQSLNLHETKATPAGIEAFKKALPKCIVTE